MLPYLSKLSFGEVRVALQVNLLPPASMLAWEAPWSRIPGVSVLAWVSPPYKSSAEATSDCTGTCLCRGYSHMREDGGYSSWAAGFLHTGHAEYI